MRSPVIGVIFGVLTAVASAAEPWRVVPVDGDDVPAANIAWVDDGRQLQLGPRTIPVDDVRWIVSATEAAAAPDHSPGVQVWFAGGRLNAVDVGVAREQVQINRGAGQSWTLPLEAVRSVWWGPAAPPAAFTAAVAEPHPERDRFLLLVNDAPTLIDGFLESVSADQIRLEWMDDVRDVARQTCLGFITARAAKTSPPAARFTVRLRDGSLIPTSGIFFRDDAVVCRVAESVDWALPVREIDRIGVATNRILYLSDLTPNDVRAETIVALPRPWQADRSVTGRPLPTVSARGVGLQAGTWLTYDIAARDAASFAVDVGLDPVTGKTGDCVAVIRGDGRELYRQRLRGGEAPVTVRVDLNGIARLELGVDPGENLDLGDHVNWNDARLIRPRRNNAQDQP